MELMDQKTDVKEIAVVLMSLPEKARERICFMIEGALLTQDRDQPRNPQQTAPRSPCRRT